MRILLLLALFSLAASPAAAQGIVVPVRCQGACPAGGLPRSLPIDSVHVFGGVRRGYATIYVDHVFRNGTAGTIDGAFFFPLPAGATIQAVVVHAGSDVEQYSQGRGREESRAMLERIARGRPDSGLREYAGVDVVHVPVPSIPPHGVRRVQIIYSQMLPEVDGTLAFRYPLSVGADASPIGDLRIGLTIRTEAGFVELHSPSHAVDVEPGTEGVPCPRPMRCGYRGAASFRVKVVRLRDGQGDRTRDFEILYTPEEAAGRLGVASIP